MQTIDMLNRYDDAFDDDMTLIRMDIIKRGSQALFMYAAGDCDEVTVLSLMPDGVVMMAPNGTVSIGCVEDIGIGVDETLVAYYDDGTHETFC